MSGQNNVVLRQNEFVLRQIKIVLEQNTLMMKQNPLMMRQNALIKCRFQPEMRPPAMKTPEIVLFQDSRPHAAKSVGLAYL
jgi:hypothetical protein